MSVSETIKTNLAYGKEIVESGIDGANQARRTAFERQETTDLVAEAAQESWQAAALGAMVGAIFGVLADDRKPVRGVIAGGLLGLAAGFAGSFAWKTRPLTGAMAREAGKRIGAVRDERWLAENPVNYG